MRAGSATTIQDRSARCYGAIEAKLKTEVCGSDDDDDGGLYVPEKANTGRYAISRISRRLFWAARNELLKPFRFDAAVPGSW